MAKSSRRKRPSARSDGRSDSTSTDAANKRAVKMAREGGERSKDRRYRAAQEETLHTARIRAWCARIREKFKPQGYMRGALSRSQFADAGLGDFGSEHLREIVELLLSDYVLAALRADVLARFGYRDTDMAVEACVSELLDHGPLELLETIDDQILASVMMALRMQDKPRDLRNFIKKRSARRLAEQIEDRGGRPTSKVTKGNATALLLFEAAVKDGATKSEAARLLRQGGHHGDTFKSGRLPAKTERAIVQRMKRIREVANRDGLTEIDLLNRSGMSAEDIQKLT